VRTQAFEYAYGVKYAKSIWLKCNSAIYSPKIVTLLEDGWVETDRFCGKGHCQPGRTSTDYTDAHNMNRNVIALGRLMRR
jgi:hypothetical protein